MVGCHTRAKAVAVQEGNFRKRAEAAEVWESLFSLVLIGFQSYSPYFLEHSFFRFSFSLF